MQPDLVLSAIFMFLPSERVVERAVTPEQK